MADPMSGLDMVREIIGQINNLRKLVTVNGKQYKYDPKSKSYKADGKTFTPSQLKAQLKGQSYKAPKIDNKSKLKIKQNIKRTGKLSPGGISRPDKGTYGRNLPSKDKYGVPSQKKRLLKPKTTPKSTQTKTKGPKIADPWRGTYSTPKENLKINKDIKARKKGFFEKYGVTNKDIKNVERTGKKKDGTYKMSRATKAQVNQSNYGRKNAALAILGKAADWGVDQLVDRGARQIAGKSKMTLEEFRKARDKGELKGTLKKKILGTPLKGSEELSAHRRGRQKGDQPSTTSKKTIKNTDKPDRTSTNIVAGDSEKKNGGNNSNNSNKAVDKKETKPKKWGDSAAGKTAEKAFMEKAKAGRNAAVNAGMDPKKLWEQRKKHRQFLIDNNRKIPKSLR